MIPRYQPTYGFSDLNLALRLCRQSDVLETLKRRLGQLMNRRYVFLFDSARVALYVLLKAYDRPGKVIVPAYNCIVVPEAVGYAGYQPVFADIDPGTLNMTASTMAGTMTSDVTAVLMTHQFGIPCEVDKIIELSRQHKALVIEDAAAALGASINGQPAGSFGDASIISFGNTKVVSAGSGGALLTNNSDIARRVEKFLPEQRGLNNTTLLSRLFYGYAWKTAFASFVFPVLRKSYGLLKKERLFQIIQAKKQIPDRFISSCHPFSAALLFIQLDRLGANIAQRNRLGRHYRECLTESFLRFVNPASNSVSSWIQFPVILNKKEAFFSYMKNCGIDLSWTFRYSCADNYDTGNCPNARNAAKSVLGLPTYPSLTIETATSIAQKAIAFKDED